MVVRAERRRGADGRRVGSPGKGSGEEPEESNESGGSEPRKKRILRFSAEALDYVWTAGDGVHGIKANCPYLFFGKL